MKKYLPYIFIIITAFGILSPVFSVQAQSPDGQGTCLGPSKDKLVIDEKECKDLKKITKNNYSWVASNTSTTPTPAQADFTKCRSSGKFSECYDAFLKTLPQKTTGNLAPAAVINNTTTTKTEKLAACPGDTTAKDNAIIQCGRKFICEETKVLDKDGKVLSSRIVKTVDPQNMCDFNAVMDTVNRIITFLLLLSLPVVAIMFAYAGFTLVTAGGESAHARTKAKAIFFSAVIGLVIAFCAYIIIHLILTTLGYDGGWIGL